MPEPARTARLIFLHLAPGVLIFLFYVLAAPAVMKLGLPRVGALLLAFSAVGMPLQLGIMKRQATAEGKKSLRQIVAFREPISFWLAAALVLGSFVLAMGLLALLPLVSTDLAEKVFWWFPAAAWPTTAAAGVGTVVFVTLLCQILIDGVANPIVEEMYFRGYLLPRLSHFGWLAPILNTALFTVAHLWQPYNYVTIFVMVLPLTIITWWRKNIYIQMIVHCMANTIGATLSLVAYLQSAE